MLQTSDNLRRESDLPSKTDFSQRMNSSHPSPFRSPNPVPSPRLARLQLSPIPCRCDHKHQQTHPATCKEWACMILSSGLQNSRTSICGAATPPINFPFLNGKTKWSLGIPPAMSCLSAIASCWLINEWRLCMLQTGNG